VSFFWTNQSKIGIIHTVIFNQGGEAILKGGRFILEVIIDLRCRSLFGILITYKDTKQKGGIISSNPCNSFAYFSSN
jgi:hypothetical protein